MTKKNPEPLDLESAMAEAEAGCAQYEKNAGKSDIELIHEKREEEALRQRIKGRGDVQQILKIVEVRRTLWRILEICGPYQPSFDPLSARQSDYNEGKRAIGIEVLKIIMDADPAAYMQILNEHNSDKKTESERRKKEQDEITGGVQ